MAAGADLFATMVVYFFFFFFFQAEDGIRDKLVTGVQTCALPISDGAAHGVRRRDPRSRRRRSVLPGRALRRAARGSQRLVGLGGVPRQARTGAGRSDTARRDSGVRAAAARPRRDVGVELRPQVRAAQLAQSRSSAVGLDHPDGQGRPGQEQPVREASREAQAVNATPPDAPTARPAATLPLPCRAGRASGAGCPPPRRVHPAGLPPERRWCRYPRPPLPGRSTRPRARSEEHTSELQSLAYLVCRLLLEKKKNEDSRDELAYNSSPCT